MHLSGFLGTDATHSQATRKFSLQKALKAARLHRLIEPSDPIYIPDGYANAVVKLDQVGQIEFLEIAVRFTEHNADWTMFVDYLVVNASPGLMKQICMIAFAGDIKPTTVLYDVYPDIDDIR
jgi:hypothetical protein